MLNFNGEKRTSFISFTARLPLTPYNPKESILVESTISVQSFAFRTDRFTKGFSYSKSSSKYVSISSFFPSILMYVFFFDFCFSCQSDWDGFLWFSVMSRTASTVGGTIKKARTTPVVMPIAVFATLTAAGEKTFKASQAIKAALLAATIPIMFVSLLPWFVCSLAENETLTKSGLPFSKTDTPSPAPDQCGINMLP